MPLRRPWPHWGRVPAVALAFVLLWNSGFIGAEAGLPYAGPYTLLLWRYVGVTTLLGLALMVRRELAWPGWPAAATAGGVGVLAHGVWLACVLVPIDAGVPAGIVALVTALQPLLTGALAGLVTREATSPRQWAGLVLGFAGVAIAVGTRIEMNPAAPGWAYLVPFGSAAGITVASLWQRRLTQAGSPHLLGGALGLFYQGAATALVLLVPAAAVGHLQTAWRLPFLAVEAWLVVGVSVGAYAAMWVLLRWRDATRVASLFYLSPPVTMAMAWLAFGDAVTLTDLLGLAVGATGVLLVYRPQRGRQASGGHTTPSRAAYAG